MKTRISYLTLEKFHGGMPMNCPPKHGDFEGRDSPTHVFGSYRPKPGITVQWEKKLQNRILVGRVAILRTASGESLAEFRRTIDGGHLWVEIAGDEDWLLNIFLANRRLSKLLDFDDAGRQEVCQECFGQPENVEGDFCVCGQPSRWYMDAVYREEEPWVQKEYATMSR